jgi:hypothetical protein
MHKPPEIHGLVGCADVGRGGMDGRRDGISRRQVQKPPPLLYWQQLHVQAVDVIGVSLEVELMEPIIAKPLKIHGRCADAAGQGESRMNFATCVLLLPSRYAGGRG